jgi:thiamine-monophosphate kinase
MKLSEIGQFGMIDVVAKMIEESRDNRIDSWHNLLNGVGDDCAVWKGNPANQLAKVDCQVEGVHFNLDLISWEDLGWKSLAVNLSDIAAMGGLPDYALVSLGLPLDTRVEDVVLFYKGLLKLARQSGTAVVGGNMSSSPHVFVDVMVIGKTTNPGGRYLTRGAAQPGDQIAVTGWLGTPAAGLEMLKWKLNFSVRTKNYLRLAFTHPEPRLVEGQILIKSGVKTAIDISDGLLSDLGHICKASKVGAVIYPALLPVRSEVKRAFGERSLHMALSGGEDYQLLITAKSVVIERARKNLKYPLTVIGEIKADKTGENKIEVLDEKGSQISPQNTAWDHFRRERQ